MQEPRLDASVHCRSGVEKTLVLVLTNSQICQDFKGSSSGPQSNTWLSKTLSSIKEVAGEDFNLISMILFDVEKTRTQVLDLNFVS